MDYYTISRAKQCAEVKSLSIPSIRESIHRSSPTEGVNLPSYEAQRRFSPNVLIVGETGAGKSSVVNLIAGETLAHADSGAAACTLEATSYDIREVHKMDGLPSYKAQRRFSPNILIVGETGAGKSSVVNLIAGETLAQADSGAAACTLEATSYDIVLPGSHGLSHHIRLFDTVGLNEPHFKREDYLSVIEKANTLICQLRRTGGIRLLVFCIRGGRITAVMQNNYRLFCDILCQNQVPVAFVITGLENEEPMEAWWERNVASFETCRLFCASHACVTAIRGLDGIYSAKYDESQRRIRDMLLSHVAGTVASWKPERTGWFVDLASKLLRWLSQVRGHHRQALTVQDLARHLREKCNFSRSEGLYLARRIWAERLKTPGPDFVKADDVSLIGSPCEDATLIY